MQGLECYNSASRLQYSSEITYPSLIRKGTHNVPTNLTPTNAFGRYTTRLDLANVSDTAILAIKPNNNMAIGFFYKLTSGTTQQFLFFTNANSGSFDWWLFDIVPPSGINVGLQAFLPNGSLAFETSANPIRINQIIQQATYNQDISDKSINIPASTVLAVAFGGRSGYSYYTEAGTPDGQKTRYGFRSTVDHLVLSGSTYTMQYQVPDQSAAFTTDTSVINNRTYFGARNIFIIDVTNY